MGTKDKVKETIGMSSGGEGDRKDGELGCKSFPVNLALS